MKMKMKRRKTKTKTNKFINTQKNLFLTMLAFYKCGIGNNVKRTFISGFYIFNRKMSVSWNRTNSTKSEIIKHKDLIKSNNEFFQDELHKLQFSQIPKTISLQKIQEIEKEKDDIDEKIDDDEEEEEKEKEEEEEERRVKEDNSTEEKPLTPKERRKLKAKYYRDTKLYRGLFHLSFVSFSFMDQIT
jgi:hypothetical protein